MKFLRYIIASITLSLYPALYGQTPTAVIPFAARGIAEKEAAILSDRFSAELAQTNRFRLIERELTDRILAEQGLQQTGTISDSSAVQVGKLLGAEQIIGGSISKLGSAYSLSARLINVETGVVLRAATYDHAGRKEELLSFGMKYLAQKLANDETADTQNSAEDYPPPLLPSADTGMAAPFQLALISPLQLFRSKSPIHGLRINLIYGNNRAVAGLDVGIINVVGSDMNGLQAGVINRAGSLYGLQAGLVNCGRSVSWLQAGVVNSGHSVRGLQVGLVNVARKLYGVQIGLVNRIEQSHGPKTLPFINVGF